MGYKLCPRCELNYIKEEEEYCDVCKAELKIGPQLIFAVDEDDDLREKLCPYCKQNYIPVGSDMCDQCREDSMYVEEKEVDIANDEGWRTYLDDEPDDLAGEDNEEMLSLNKLQEEEADELFDDEEEEEYFEEESEDNYREPDDFDETYEDFNPDDFDQDDDEEEAEDDDDDDGDDF